MALSVDIRKALGNFHLAVQFDAGDETLALLGASGCGKSVTLKCIAGILTPDEGHIELDGVAHFCHQWLGKCFRNHICVHQHHIRTAVQKRYLSNSPLSW